MKNILILLPILLLTIIVVGQKTNPKIKNRDKILLPLNSYKADLKKVNDKFVRNYEKLNLTVSSDSSTFDISVNKRSIFTPCDAGFESQIEVFDNSYILISFLKGTWNGAGPDYFPRDSVYILELKTARLNLVRLPGILLTRSKTLLEIYSHTGKVAYQAIHSIDLSHNQVRLIDQYGKLTTVTTKSVSENESYTMRDIKK